VNRLLSGQRFSSDRPTVFAPPEAGTEHLTPPIPDDPGRCGSVHSQ